MPEPGGPGGPLAPPIFGRSVNPIRTGESRLSPPITTGPLNVFHLPASLRRYDDLKQKKCDSKGTTEEDNSLSYQKVIFPFLIVLCGMFFACITLGIENMIL